MFFFSFFFSKFFFKNFNFSTLLWGAVRVQSGVANLESWYDCSNSFGFREMAFFLNFFSKKIKYKKIEPNLKFSTLYWVAVKVHSGVENLASKYGCLNPFGFRDMAFYDFFKKT